MAFVDELKAVFIFVGRTVRDFFDFDSNGLGKYLRYGAFALSVALLGVGGFLGYRMYVGFREQKAHQSFSDYLQEFQAASKSNSQPEWERMVTVFGNRYADHKDSSLAPLFLSLKAEAHVQLGQIVEAINTVQQAIDSLPADSALLPLLQIKQSLMQLDANDDALSKVGLQQLVSLARDQKNSLKDMALFYLGRYYWANDQIEDAQKAWKELEDSSWGDKAYPSPWVQEAKQKLKQRAA